MKLHAEIQIKELKGCCITDEIALTFSSDVAERAEILLQENLIEKNQYTCSSCQGHLKKFRKNL